MYLYVLPHLSGQRVESRLLEISDAPYSFAIIPIHHDEAFVTSHIHSLIGVDTLPTRSENSLAIRRFLAPSSAIHQSCQQGYAHAAYFLNLLSERNAEWRGLAARPYAFRAGVT